MLNWSDLLTFAFVTLLGIKASLHVRHEPCVYYRTSDDIFTAE